LNYLGELKMNQIIKKILTAGTIALSSCATLNSSLEARLRAKYPCVGIGKVNPKIKNIPLARIQASNYSRSEYQICAKEIIQKLKEMNSNEKKEYLSSFSSGITKEGHTSYDAHSNTFYTVPSGKR
jgi:hypothetical protein